MGWCSSLVLLSTSSSTTPSFSAGTLVTSLLSTDGSRERLTDRQVGQWMDGCEEQQKRMNNIWIYKVRLKTQVQVVGKEPEQVNITVDSQTLEQVKSFTYLGGVITENALSDQGYNKKNRHHHPNESHPVPNTCAADSTIWLRNLDPQGC